MYEVARLHTIFTVHPTEAQEFKKKFEEAMDINAPLLGDVAALPKADESAGGAAADKEAEELAKEVEGKATTKDE